MATTSIIQNLPVEAGKYDQPLSQFHMLEASMCSQHMINATVQMNQCKQNKHKWEKRKPKNLRYKKCRWYHLWV